MEMPIPHLPTESEIMTTSESTISPDCFKYFLAIQSNYINMPTMQRICSDEAVLCVSHHI